jgi:DNA protecting protein DprA
MNPTSDRFRRRLAVAARAPNLSAPQLLQLEDLGADLAALEQPDRAGLARLGLSTGAIDWLATPTKRSSPRICVGSMHRALSCCQRPPPTTHPCCSNRRTRPAFCTFAATCGSSASRNSPWSAVAIPPAGGRANAREFAMFFAHAGITITSGLALGIDTACHEGALAGGGPTVAVLGCGLDQIYPRENQALADRIAATGAVITEFPPGSSPLPAYFPQRNRIIAGLSHGTLVVEAAQRSGSLITARLAGVAGREVFAIPGSIHNPLARGMPPAHPAGSEARRASRGRTL